MENVRWAETPTGDHYTVIAAPPGSALDAGNGRALGGLLGALTAVVVVATRSLRRGWRIAVTPCDQRGRPTGTTYRERVPDEHAADTRTQHIVDMIRRGQWPENSAAGTEE